MITIRFALGDSDIRTWKSVARFMQDRGFEPSFNGNYFSCEVTSEFADELRTQMKNWGY